MTTAQQLVIFILNHTLFVSIQATITTQPYPVTIIIT